VVSINTRNRIVFLPLFCVQTTCLSPFLNLTLSTGLKQKYFPATTTTTQQDNKMAEEARAISASHQAWIIETLKASDGGACTYEKLVEVGEEKHCDTVGAMLKIMKTRKAIKFEQIFLMYPMHKAEIVSTCHVI
jgi:hypothetical protein